MVVDRRRTSVGDQWSKSGLGNGTPTDGHGRDAARNVRVMANWQDVAREAPELATKARRAFDANKHKTMATLRKDGGPRISGTELDFTDDGLFFGSMWGAVKARDLQRDPRIAFHSAT